MRTEIRLPHGTIALPSLAGEGNGMGATRRSRRSALTTLSRAAGGGASQSAPFFTPILSSFSERTHDDLS